MGVLYGINVNSFSKMFDYDGNGEFYLGFLLGADFYELTFYELTFV